MSLSNTTDSASSAFAAANPAALFPENSQLEPSTQALCSEQKQEPGDFYKHLNSMAIERTDEIYEAPATGATSATELLPATASTASEQKIDAAESRVALEQYFLNKCKLEKIDPQAFAKAVTQGRVQSAMYDARVYQLLARYIEEKSIDPVNTVALFNYLYGYDMSTLVRRDLPYIPDDAATILANTLCTRAETRIAQVVNRTPGATYNDFNDFLWTLDREVGYLNSAYRGLRYQSPKLHSEQEFSERHEHQLRVYIYLVVTTWFAHGNHDLVLDFSAPGMRNKNRRILEELKVQYDLRTQKKSGEKSLVSSAADTVASAVHSIAANVRSSWRKESGRQFRP